jgi:hypothetical protein
METKVYRIYTETKENLIPLVKACLKNVTIYNGIGIYNSILENCTVIESIIYDNDILEIDWFNRLTKIIKSENGQESVLITIQDIKVYNV